MVTTSSGPLAFKMLKLDRCVFLRPFSETKTDVWNLVQLRSSISQRSFCSHIYGVSIPAKIQTCFCWIQTFSSSILSCNLNSQSFNSNIQFVISNIKLVNSNIQFVNSNLQLLFVNSNIQFVNSHIQFGNSNVLRSMGTRKGCKGRREAVSSIVIWAPIHTTLGGGFKIDSRSAFKFLNLPIQTFNLSIQTLNSSIQTFNLSIETFNSSVQTFNLAIETFFGVSVRENGARVGARQYPVSWSGHQSRQHWVLVSRSIQDRHWNFQLLSSK